ncbi:UDP-N-acetylmuramate dehydrogenase [Desulfuribacillus alkaliarsenatis]|uniref:UDP-N-acetylmuramate dehydrogenase n=1 Tax=Desulfuribacillus alkaliarsenatis TaxID=766136 RepID=UPI00159F2EB9|nr:UDP-N-acetylmuramate dehydrogenase [Desulfuribacillus alkaliarsenatis]
MKALTFESLCVENEMLARHSSYEIGGSARFYATPETVDELICLLDACKQKGIPCEIFGYGSNILFPDEPYAEKMYISLKRMIDCNIAASGGEAKLFLAAGVPLSFLPLIGVLSDYESMYFTHLLPGTIGAGIYINAKCYEYQMSELLNRIYYIDIAKDSSSIQSIAVEDCSFAYKESIFQKRPWIIIGADFLVPNLTRERYLIIQNLLQLYKQPYTDITSLANFYKHFQAITEDISKEHKVVLPKRFQEIDEDRSSKRHFSYPSCGSVFKNNYKFGRPMGVVVDELGLKGKEYGGAMISPYHGNFIINHKQAKAADVIYLIKFVQEQVNNKHGFIPEPEVIIISE